jgi:YD repeat-containing protein
MQVVYADGNRRITTCRDLNTPGDLAMVQVTSYDQLGQVNGTAQLESSNPNGSNCADTPPGGILTDIRYQTKTGASYKLESNPYRVTSDPTMGWTLTQFDTLGRPVSVTSYSGGSAPAPWGGTPPSTGTVTTSYSSNNQTIRDQAGVTRTQQMDGLGRLLQVTEAGTAVTTYSYDALDDLTSVAGGGHAP